MFRIIFLPVLFLLISFFSCNSYPHIEISKNIFGHNYRQKQANTIDEILKRYRSSLVNEKSYPAGPGKINTVYYKRYFADPGSSSPLNNINNAGVVYALRGMYSQAGILFSEALREDSSFSPALNNLGVIHELNDNYDKAFEMYSQACILEPGNKFYRWNFLYFCDKKSKLD